MKINQNSEHKQSVVSGLYFSALIIIILLVSVIFTIGTSPGGELVKGKLWYKLVSYSLSGLAIIVLTAYLSNYTDSPIVEFCNIRKTDKKYYFLAVLLFVSAFLGLGGINGYFIEFLSKNFDYVPTTVELPEFSVVNFILVTITLCILPAITEEIAFRGVVLKGLKCGNIYVNALIGGLLFSIFHMNPAQTPYQFAMGFCFSLIAIKSKSSLPVMLAHFLNNFIVVVVEYFFVSVFSNDTILMITTITGLILLALFLVFIVRDKGQAEKQDNEDGKQFFIYASIGIIICVAMWTINLIG